MHTLIIKGDTIHAFAACDAHSVEILSIVKHPQFDECIVTTVDTADTLRSLTGWFCEHSGTPPAPAGTLMWYGPTNTAPLPFDNLVQGESAALVQARLQGDTATVTQAPKGWDRVKTSTEDSQ